MKYLLLLPLLVFSTQAFASHPHDRVCIGSAKMDAQDSVDFVFQWEIERLYDHGDPNMDTHAVTAQASSCYGDYQSDICEKATAEPVQIKGGEKSSIVHLQLKDKKGETFFVGKFDITKEILVGKMNRGPGKPSTVKGDMAQVSVKLNCVSQPRLTLEGAQD